MKFSVEFTALIDLRPTSVLVQVYKTNVQHSSSTTDSSLSTFSLQHSPKVQV